MARPSIEKCPWVRANLRCPAGLPQLAPRRRTRAPCAGAADRRRSRSPSPPRRRHRLAVAEGQGHRLVGVARDEEHPRRHLAALERDLDLATALRRPSRPAVAGREVGRVVPGELGDRVGAAPAARRSRRSGRRAPCSRGRSPPRCPSTPRPTGPRRRRPPQVRRRRLGRSGRPGDHPRASQASHARSKPSGPTVAAQPSRDQRVAPLVGLVHEGGEELHLRDALVSGAMSGWTMRGGSVAGAERRPRSRRGGRPRAASSRRCRSRRRAGRGRWRSLPSGRPRRRSRSAGAV